MKTKKIFIFYLIIVFASGMIFGYWWGSQWHLNPNNQSLSLDLIVRDLANKNLDADLFQQVWNIIKGSYVKQPVSDTNLFYGSLEGMVGALKDPYSVFLDPETAKKFNTEITGKFEGIGIEIGIKNNQLLVIAPLANTPAIKAGLKAGDKILSIDGQETTGMSVDQAANLIRGKRGSKVVLTIWREGWEKSKDIPIIRDKIEVPTIKWEMKKNNIVYLNISHFNNETMADLSKAVRTILKQNPQKIILDLRNNPGGYLDVAVDSAGLWLPDQLITYSKDAKGQKKDFAASGQGEFSKLKTVVLVNRGSASGAEILAGALQDYQKAILMGERTFGKGSVQELVDLAGGSAVKITTAYWYTPKGRQINDAGIEPDVKVELTDKDYNQNRDPQLDKAMELLE